MRMRKPDNEADAAPHPGTRDVSGSEEETDEALAALAGRGDTHAFEGLLTRYERYIYKCAYSVASNREDAADLAQEIFLNLWRALPSYRGDAKFFTYLAGIARNASADYIRRQKKTPATCPLSPTPDDDAPAVSEPAAPPEDASPDYKAEQNERQTVLYRAIARLSEEHRTVLILCDMEGYSYDQIASVLGLDRGTVKSRLHRARANLKEILEKFGFFP